MGSGYTDMVAQIKEQKGGQGVGWGARQCHRGNRCTGSVQVIVRTWAFTLMRWRAISTTQAVVRIEYRGPEREQGDHWRP